jgi:hypothetical protein
MKKINIQDWKEFKIEELFSINPTKNHKVTNKDLMHEDGLNPVVVNSSYNNGIGGYTNYEITEPGNVITFSDTTNADSIFYQENDFVGYSHVQVLKPIKYNEKWSKECLIFFTAVFKKKAKLMNFDYVNKFTREDALKIIVKLPIDVNGEPDWEYMERYVKLLYARERESSYHVTTYVKKSKLHEIDINNWKEFTLPELSLEIIKPNVFHTREIKESSEMDVAYIVRSKFNNGIKCYIEKNNNIEINPSGVITFGAENATFFYQKQPFISGRDIYYIDTRSLSEKTCLFLVSCLQKITDKYTYNNGLFPKDLIKEKIKLPVKSDNSPDWQYMEEYMKKLETSMKNMIKANINEIIVS